ncbi:hypothetical protein HNR48_000718 [Pseudoteredinibacter isoporae]|uniref:Uncharacterized protein n=1 Tax=Pseudoteredinibacter isoporae TaxID=570281 RepID=A0A7X0MUW3_9GAMM|nr:hypothetical protein [Pseudoteredinibacter isoporae]
MRVKTSDLQHIDSLATVPGSLLEQIFEAARYRCFQTEGKNSEWLWFNLRVTLLSVFMYSAVLIFAITSEHDEVLFLGMPISCCLLLYFALKIRRQKYMDMVHPYIANAVASYGEAGVHKERSI